MFARKQCIERIEFHLSQIQAEIKLNNATSLFDINQTAEDIICHLLNLIYGWDLENENHQRQNAAAVDLTDRKGRLAVQVTSDNSREKIQSTIDTFIAHSLYQYFDKLYILLLTDKKKQKKPFQTSSLFSFDSEQHIIDFRDLVKKLRTLDTATLKKIALYLDEELKDVSAAPVHKRRFLPIPVVVTLIVLMVIVAVWIYSYWRNTPAAQVYFSQIMPYTEAGYVASYDNASPIYRTEIETSKAFSILSFVRSSSDTDSRIENLSCHILSLEPIEDPVLVLDAVIVDNTLRLFAFNDGWGTGEAVRVDAASLGQNNNMEPLSQITNDERYFENTDIAPASAVLLAEFDLDSVKFQNFLERCDGLSQSMDILIQASSGDDSFRWSAYLSFWDGEFQLDYGGLGDFADYDITLFAMLDVDSRPSEITFTGRNSTPRVAETLRVETVLVPTKSCVVKCQNEFLINGAVQQTDIFTATVSVPIFRDLVMNRSGPLTKELAQLDVPDEVRFKRILQEYLYDPESILNQQN